MVTAPSRSRLTSALWKGAPVVLTALLGIGYIIGILAIEGDSGAGVAHTTAGWLPAAIVLAQAAVLPARYKAPGITLVVVAALDALTLLISSGEGSTGSFAVMVAVYAYTRSGRTPTKLIVTAAIAVVDVVITVLALQTSSEIPPEWSFPFALLRNGLIFGGAVVIAEIVDGRAQLLSALRERADAAEREKGRRAEEAVLRERALMARELHDIAAHHLSGIIVSAQAAEALRASDSDRAGQYIRQIQTDARTTLNNLRQTVGLLRTDTGGDLAPVPSVEQLPALVAEASAAGTSVQFHQSGTPTLLGPLAGIAVYRMVQESLTNARVHAVGAMRGVEVDYGWSALVVTVRNGPAASAVRGTPDHGGYGLIGMAERAELIGATLTTGPTADGGWANSLTIPHDGDTP